MGIMKYFRNMLMGNEMFSEIFDGTKNTFLCSIFVMLFLSPEGWSTRYLNQPSSRFKKGKSCSINHIHSVDIRQIVVKIKKMFDAF